MPLIKICGLSDHKSVRAADEADYAGFVVGSPKSHRNISVEKFQDLRSGLTHAKPVLVTVNQSMKFLHELQQIGDVILQLYGYARQFADMIADSAIGLNYEEYKASLFTNRHSYLSIDSIAELGYGGTGKAWNWKKIHSANVPTLVAGGIGFDNVEAALLQTNAQGVDVSSAVEENKQKVPSKISDFIDIVRGLA